MLFVYVILFALNLPFAARAFQALPSNETLLSYDSSTGVAVVEVTDPVTGGTSIETRRAPEKTGNPLMDNVREIAQKYGDDAARDWVVKNSYRSNGLKVELGNAFNRVVTHIDNLNKLVPKRANGLIGMEIQELERSVADYAHLKDIATKYSDLGPGRIPSIQITTKFSSMDPVRIEKVEFSGKDPDGTTRKFDLDPRTYTELLILRIFKFTKSDGTSKVAETNVDRLEPVSPEKLADSYAGPRTSFGPAADEAFGGATGGWNLDILSNMAADIAR